MKRNMKIMLYAGLAAMTFGLVSCGDWIEPKSLEVKTPSLEESDPAAWAEYLKELNNYKNSEHKLVFVTFDNPTGVPANHRSEHLTVVPDLVDYIILNNPDNLHADFLAEFGQVRRKGTKVLYTFNFEAFDAAWREMARNDASLTEEQRLEYITDRTKEALALCDKWGYDGLVFGYTGFSPLSIPDSQREAAVALQGAFFAPVIEWQASHKGKVLAFMGRPDFVLEEESEIFGICNYIMVDTDNATNEGDLSVRCLKAIDSEAVPTDRIVVTALEIRPDDNNQVFGWFGTVGEDGNKLRALPEVARWITLPSPQFTRAGLVVKDIQTDYFNVKETGVYPHLNQAISIMNPSLIFPDFSDLN